MLTTKWKQIYHNAMILNLAGIGYKMRLVDSFVFDYIALVTIRDIVRDLI